MTEITIIILTKNEEGNIEWVIDELKRLSLNNIIVVDSGSTDNTVQILKSKNVKHFIQSQKGYGAAILEAVGRVDTKYLSVIDADGSYDSRDIPKMLNILKTHDLDFVLGSRYLGGNKSEDDTLIRLIGNFFFTKLTRIIFNINITDALFHFPVCKTSSYKYLNLKFKDFAICVEMPVMINENNLKFKEFFSKERPRMTGESKVNALKDGIIILYQILKLFYLQKIKS